MIEKPSTLQYYDGDDQGLIMIKSSKIKCLKGTEAGFTSVEKDTSLGFKVEKGKMETCRSELDHFISFFQDLQSCTITGLSKKEGLMPRVKASKEQINKDEYAERNFRFYRDFYRSYLHYLDMRLEGKNSFRNKVRSITDLPKFLYEELGWKNDAIIMDVIIFHIFNKQCGNDDCDNFAWLKCSACKMIHYCSKACQETDYYRRHKRICSYHIRRRGYKARKVVPLEMKGRVMKAQLFNGQRDYTRKTCVSVRTFSREVCRQICLVFMEALEFTKIMTLALEKRKGGENAEIPKFNQEKFHTVLDNYNCMEPVIPILGLRKQMESVYGPDNFLSVAMRRRQ